MSFTLNFVKKIKKVRNHKITIALPKDFKSEKVEVIVVPVQNEDITIMTLSKESFDEWNNEEDDIYNNT